MPFLAPWGPFVWKLIWIYVQSPSQTLFSVKAHCVKKSEVIELE